MAVWKRRSRFGITFARMEMGGVDDTAGAALVGDSHDTGLISMGCARPRKGVTVMLSAGFEPVLCRPGRDSESGDTCRSAVGRSRLFNREERRCVRFRP